MTVQMISGPDRIYDEATAKTPPPVKHPLGFAPGVAQTGEKEPQLWEGDGA